MQNLLIVGVDTVVGANLAAFLGERRTVTTFSSTGRLDLPHCSALDPLAVPSEAVQSARPDWVLYCGPAARSSWEPGASRRIDDSLIDEAAQWASAASAAGARMAMISSDAVFTGPWMFHEEDSPSLCQSAQAMIVRAAEKQVLELNRSALIIRTNAFGWGLGDAQQDWLECLLGDIRTRRVVQQDHVRHATPILATDLADIVDRACQEGTSGIHHVGGAERVSPLKFAQRLADQFNLPWLSIRREGALSAPASGYGAGECSLQTKKIRKALCVAMPLLSEGLSRLNEQLGSGYRDALRTSPSAVESRAA